MDQGIPVFTAGVTSRGHEFTNFTQVPDKLEGETAGKTVLDWMKANNKDLKVFAVSGGDPTQFWAQGRMKGFHETIMKAIPDAKFVTTEANGLNVSYDPGQTYDTYRTFLSANPDVQFIENVDIGAEHADRAITSLNKTGQVFTIGWNVSKGQLDGIEKGIAGRGARSALVGPGGFRRPGLRAIPEERRHPAQHADAVAGDEGSGRRGAHGTRPHPRSEISCRRLSRQRGRRASLGPPPPL